MVNWVEWTAFGLLGCVVIPAAVTDCRTRKVPNALLYTAILLGLAWWLLAGFLDERYTPLMALGSALLGLAAGFVPFAVLFAAGAIGGSDVKLMGAVGAVSGSWQVVLATAVYGLLISVIVALFVMVKKRVVKRTFARIFGAVLLWSSRTKADLESDTHQIPLALGFAIGALIAGAEILLDVSTPWRGMGHP